VGGLECWLVHLQCVVEQLTAGQAVKPASRAVCVLPSTAAYWTARIGNTRLPGERGVNDLQLDAKPLDLAHDVCPKLLQLSLRLVNEKLGEGVVISHVAKS